MSKNIRTNKDHKMLFWLTMLILFTVFPGLFVFGIIVYLVYKNKHNIKTKINEYENNSKKDTIETNAEILHSTIINENDEWTATKEYKH